MPQSIIPVGIQLRKAEVGPTSGPTWRLSHLRPVRATEGILRPLPSGAGSVSILAAADTFHGAPLRSVGHPLIYCKTLNEFDTPAKHSRVWSECSRKLQPHRALVASHTCCSSWAASSMYERR